MNSMLVETKVVELTTNTWKFPERINFSCASNYIIKLDNINLENTVVFDLTETNEVHSSFLGFLIDLKRKIDKNNGKLELQLSSYMIEILNQINLYDHLVSKAS